MATSDAALPPGPGVTIKHHEIIRHLGGGGMGDVYLARDIRLGRLVALKFLSEATSTDRFIAEARVTAGLTHENIVGLHDIDEHQGKPYMVLEYISGRTFKELFKSRLPAPPEADFVPLAPELAVELMLPVVRALVCAHDAGIIHRDLKPSNVMLTRSGVVKVLDFGIAKIAGGADAPAGAPVATSELLRGSPTITRDGEAIGSRPYMSPEQWGVAPVDRRTDLWAVGVMLYEMVTGRHPFARLPFDQLRRQVADLSMAVPNVRACCAEIGTLGTIIDRCLVKAVEHRIESAQLLLTELEELARPSDAATSQPYPGLAAFQERDAASFHGRHRAIAEVVARVAEQPLVAIIGPSGAGKSSFVRAGVIPALKHSGDRWQALIVRPGPRPLVALAELVAQQRGGVPPEKQTLVERLRNEPGLLGTELRQHARAAQARLLIFVDQAEELYTLAPADERQAFLRCLAGAGDDLGSPLRIVLALRSDFLDRMTDAPESILDAVSRNTILIRPLDREGLRAALVEPAAAAGHRFESAALVDNMLDALEHNNGALPLLQFTAAQLWELRDRDRQVLTEASHHAMGGVSGALARHADAVIGSLRSSERTWARTILLRLVTPERTRAVASARELRELGRGAAAEVDQVLARLTDARLLTVDGSADEESTVEIVHESLIDRWPLFERWLQEEQADAELTARLRSAARDWETSGRAEGLLWRGDAAKQAERWYAARQDSSALGRREERFLESVLALARRSARRRALFIGGTITTLTVAVVVVSSFAVQQNRAAIRARDATRVATARLETDDPTTQLALLREIEGIVPPTGWQADTKRALHAGIASVVLRGHTDGIDTVAFSPDGRRVASGAKDKTVRVWNVDGSGQPLVLTGHTSLITGVAFSPDGRHIASAGDTTVRVWNADGSGQSRILSGPPVPPTGVAYSADGRRIASSGADGTVRVWNADGSSGMLVLGGGTKKLTAVAFSPDGRRIATGSIDRIVRLWNADGSGKPVELVGHGSWVYDVAFSPDGRWLASSSADATVRLWSVDGSSAPIIVKTKEGPGETHGLAFSADGRQFAAGTGQGELRVWNVDRLDDPLVLSAHAAVVHGVAFSPDGSRLVSGHLDSVLRVWNVSDPKAPILVRHPRAVNSLSISPDDRRIVTAGDDHMVRVWNADGSGKPIVLAGHTAVVIRVAFSPDGRHVASSSCDDTIRVWDADGSGQPIVLTGHSNWVLGLSFSPDGKRLASSSLDKTVRIWNSDGSGLPIVLTGHSRAVTKVAFNPDGRRIVTGSSDGTVRIWNADGSGQPLVVSAGMSVFGMAISPDGHRIAFDDSQTLREWDADGSRQIRTIASPPVPIYDLAYSPDGRHIAAIHADVTAHVWNTDGSGESIALLGHTAPIQGLQYSHDGSRLVTVAMDSTMRIWRDLEPSRPDDPFLWRATNECLSVERRQQLLGVSEPLARTLYQRCLARVAAAQRE